GKARPGGDDRRGGVTIGSVQSGAFPALAPSSPAQGMRRSLTARPSAAPTSVWARGSMRPYKVPRPGACNESGAGRVSSRHALLGGRMRRLDLIPVLALVGCAPGGYTRAEVVYAEPARRRRDRARVRQPRAGARGLARPGGGTRSGQARRLDPQRKRRRSHQRGGRPAAPGDALAVPTGGGYVRLTQARWKHPVGYEPLPDRRT